MVSVERWSIRDKTVVNTGQSPPWPITDGQKHVVLGMDVKRPRGAPSGVQSRRKRYRHSYRP